MVEVSYGFLQYVACVKVFRGLTGCASHFSDRYCSFFFQLRFHNKIFTYIFYICRYIYKQWSKGLYVIVIGPSLVGRQVMAKWRPWVVWSADSSLDGSLSMHTNITQPFAQTYSIDQESGQILFKIYLYRSYSPYIRNTRHYSSDYLLNKEKSRNMY